MKKFSTCILMTVSFLFFSDIVFSQSPAIQWQKCLGGSSDDRASDVLINADGTFVVVGSSRSNDGNVTGHHGSSDSSDAWIIKLNGDGDIIWQKSIGGSKDDYFKTVIATTDNAYLCIGYTSSNNGDVSGNNGADDAWIVKINEAGNIIWSRCYGGAQNDIIVDGVKTTDGDYAVTGTSNGNAWAFKINNSGDILWQTNYGGLKGYNIILSEDNNLYALASGAISYVGGLWPNQVDLVRTPGYLYKLDNATGNSSFITYALGNSSYNYGDSAYAMCRTANAIRMSALNESYFYVEFCYDEDFYISTKPDGSNSITSQQIGSQFSRGCTNTYNDGNYTAPTHGLAAAETASGILAAGTYFDRTNWSMKGWLSDISGFSSYYGGTGFNQEETHFNAVKVFPNGNDYIVVGYTNDNGGDISGNHGNNDCWVVRLAGLNKVVGNVFIDDNNNGIKDPGELPFTHALVKTTKTNFIQSCIPYNGFYNNAVDLGTFSTTLAINRPYYTATPASKISTFSTYKNTDTANFAVHPVPGIVDCAVSFNYIPYIVKAGMPVQYNFSYTNRGTTVLSNKQVVFIKDHRLQLVNSLPAYSSISGDSIKWNIAGLPVDALGSIILNTTLDPIPLVNLGDTLESAIYIDSTGDFYRNDNYSRLTQFITGSFDPNDKEEIHGGFITPQELISGTPLDYTIHFQNTGNDTAYNIILRDTLAAKLDWDSIEVIASSHACQFNIKNSKYITCTFNNIKLVDSLHNEPLSHGYITYRIKPKSTLVSGDSILNSASIYFDLNPPIKTNAQLTIVKNRPVPVSWTGTVSTAWEDPLNWSNNAVPDENVNITIATGTIHNYFPVINSNAICRSITVKTGATVTVKTGFALKVIH